MAQPNNDSKAEEQPQYRTWTDVTGKFKMDAQFVGFKDGKVQLRRKDGRVVAVPIEKLSQVDREFAKRGVPDNHAEDSNERTGADTTSMPDDVDGHPEQTVRERDVEKPDDRPKQTVSQDDAEEPEIFIIVNGEKFPKPGLETFFVQSGLVGKDPQCTCNPVAGVFCSCNKVCTCVPVCGCVGHVRCGCVGHKSCSCVGVSHRGCTCVGVGRRGCTCVGQGHGGGVVTGCRCAPVH